MDSVDGLRYIMTFAADTSDFDAKVKRMKADLASMGKAAAVPAAAAVNAGKQQVKQAKELADVKEKDFGRRKNYDVQQETYAQRDRRLAREAAKEQATTRAVERKALEEKRKDVKYANEMKSVLKDVDSSSAKINRDKARENARADALGRRQAAARVQAEKEDAKRFAANNPVQQKKMTEREEAQQRSKMRRYEKDWADAKKENDRRSGKGSGDDSDSKDGFFGKASALVVGMELHKAQMFAQGVADGVWNAVEAAGALFASTTKEAAAFEDMEAGLKFAFGESKFADVFEKTKKEAAELSFTLQETADLVRSLGVMHINPFGDGKEIATFTSRTGEAISALMTLQDTASATGKGTKSVMIAVREFMGGNNTSLARRFDIPLTEVKEWRKETEKGKNIQEQYNILIGKLAGKYGGATKLRENNFNYLMEQLPDILQQFQAGLGAGAVKAMVPGLKSFKDALMGLVKDPKAMAGLAESFTLIGHAIGAMLRGAAQMIDLFKSIVAMQPHLPLLVAGFLAFGAAAVFVTASMTAMGLSLAVVAAGIMAIGWELAAVALVPTLIAGAVAAVAFAGGAALMTGAFFSAKQPVSGFVETLKDAKVMIMALHDAFSDWKDGVVTTTDETEKALASRGLTGWFEEIIRWAGRARVYVEGFAKGFMAAVEPMGRTVGQTFDKIVETITRVMIAFGLMTPAAETSMETAGSAGEKMGTRIGAAANLVLKAADWVNNGFLKMAESAPEMVRFLGTIWMLARFAGNSFTMMGTALMAIVDTAMLPLKILYNLLSSIVKGALLVASVIPQFAIPMAALGIDINREGLALGFHRVEQVKEVGGGMAPGSLDHFDHMFGMLRSEGLAQGMAKDLDSAVSGVTQGIPDHFRNRAKDAQSIYGDFQDIKSGMDQKDSMDAFASKLELSMKSVGESRDEAAATRARQGLAPLSANELTSHGDAPVRESYNRFMLAENGPRGPMNYDPSVPSPVNTMQSTIQLNVDGRKLAEIQASYMDDVASGRGWVMTQESKLWPSLR